MITFGLAIEVTIVVEVVLFCYGQIANNIK